MPNPIRIDIVRGVKTHAGAKKRWVPFGKEKILLRHHAGGQHLVRGTSSSTRARQRQMHEPKKSQRKALRKLLPNFW
ncbi:hypothetical protein SPOG_04380 [Schizosaccharomyces cryophilus OY26]|uniref:50S ribosomal protein L35 n=1 Tax=Schizosaccharomyces cryophilus (strain OY26 / ATCC MYA-4695 / CBS 11777 / NBRC 106824 / NRRL Y48691) TaxID=653667 RepID=S9VSX8_SCHCR|nr:uncharacterized protein SPOG_04380 [Schizosaccharomyces cryophilus OY26]EPY49269.1 hypothetical protein SPOG_04380 [Schizosaccharomyces cryophilus OY26]